MDIALRGLHVFLGELGFLFIIWTMAEVAWGSSPGTTAVLRMKIASLTGLIVIWVHWLVSGIYYVVYYGSGVKPAILAGSWPWAHGIFMESKEHVFFFLPFLAILICALVWKYKGDISEKKEAWFAFFATSGVTVFIFVIMIVSGFLVSSGYRITG